MNFNLDKSETELSRAIEIGKIHGITNADEAPSVLWILEKVADEHTELLKDYLNALKNRR